MIMRFNHRELRKTLKIVSFISKKYIKINSFSMLKNYHRRIDHNLNIKIRIF